MLRQLVRRPLFSAGAGLAVLGAAGGVYVADPAVQAPVAEVAYRTPQPVTADVAAAAAAQAEADSGDRGFQRVSRERGAQRELAVELEREARAAAAAEAAAVKAEAARVAKAERAREAAREQAARDARRDPRGIAELLVSERGWSGEQFGCLDRLWTKESNWRWNADNPTSSAYGIPQALPGSKMSSAGSDWKTNPATQIEWGLGYIDARYGTPCAAWSHSQSNNWY